MHETQIAPVWDFMNTITRSRTSVTASIFACSPRHDNWTLGKLVVLAMAGQNSLLGQVPEFLGRGRLLGKASSCPVVDKRILL
jgi:hypothetical protein